MGDATRDDTTAGAQFWTNSSKRLTLGTNGADRLTILGTGNSGFGTTTPYAKLSVMVGGLETAYASLAPSVVFAVASSSRGTATSTLYAIDSFGHHIFGGPLPTCGTGCSSIVGNDNGGAITTSAAATAVTLNFANTWTVAPVCTVSDNSTAVTGDVSAVSATSFTASFSVGLTGVVYYQCGVYQQ